MNELTFQIMFLAVFLISLASSVLKNPFLFLFSIILMIFISYRKKQYLLISGFLIVFSSLIYYLSSLQSYELFLFFMPILLVFFAILLALFFLFRIFFPTVVQGEVLSYDSKTGYAVIELPFDFFSGIQAGEYALKSKKKLVKGEKIKVKIRFRLFQPPKMVPENE